MSDMLDRLNAAHKVVVELCQGRRKWIMSVPARPDYDPDLVIGSALRDTAKEIDRLRSLATRWYLADGTFETLPEEEVTRRRIEAAKRAGDVEALAKILAHGERLVTDKDKSVEEYWNASPRYLTDAYMKRARVLVAYLSPKATP